jgi:hypothetical protein
MLFFVKELQLNTANTSRKLMLIDALLRKELTDSRNHTHNTPYAIGEIYEY